MGKKLGDILGSISPGYGLISGQGAGADILGSVSPLAGLLSGHGLFGNLFGGHKGKDKKEDNAPNPGEKMFGMTQSMDSGGGGGGSGGNPNFMSRFGRNLSDELFARAIQNMGGMGGY